MNNEVCLYGPMLENLMDQDFESDPLNILIKDEDDAGLNEDLPTCVVTNTKTQHIVIKRRHMMSHSISTVVHLLDETAVMDAPFIGATKPLHSLYMSMAWVGIGAYMANLRSVESISKAMADMSNEGELYDIEAKKLKEAESKKEEGLAMYGFSVNQIPLTNRDFVLPEHVMERLINASFSGLDEELDLESAKVQFVMKELGADGPEMKLAQKDKNDRLKERRKEQAAYARKIKDDIHTDLVNALNAYDEEAGMDEISYDLYKRSVIKIQTKATTGRRRSLALAIDNTVSEEVQNAAFGNAPIWKEVAAKAKELIQKFTAEEEATNDPILDDNDEPVMV